MNVSLPKNLDKYVHSLIKSGDYCTKSAVIQECVRFHRDQQVKPGGLTMTAELRRLVDEAENDPPEAGLTIAQVRKSTLSKSSRISQTLAPR